MEEQKKVKIHKLEEPMIIENESDLVKTKKVIKYFQKYYFNLVQYLVKSAPLYFESIITDCINITKYITSYDPEPCKYMKDLRKLPVLTYMAKFYNNIHPYAEHITQTNIDYFADKECEFKNPLVDMPVDFTKFWKTLQKEQKGLIMKHLEYLYKMTDNATSVFEISANYRQVLASKQQQRAYKRSDLKKLLYEKLNLDANNKAISIIVDDCLDEFEKQQKMFKYGAPSAEVINNMISTLYTKLTDRFSKGEINSDEIISAGKNFYEQIENNLPPEQFAQFKDLLGMNPAELKNMTEAELAAKVGNVDFMSKLQEMGIDKSIFANILNKENDNKQ